MHHCSFIAHENYILSCVSFTFFVSYGNASDFRSKMAGGIGSMSCWSCEVIHTGLNLLMTPIISITVVVYQITRVFWGFRHVVYKQTELVLGYPGGCQPEFNSEDSEVKCTMLSYTFRKWFREEADTGHRSLTHQRWSSVNVRLNASGEVWHECEWWLIIQNNPKVSSF